jgi:hypothetical protein
MHFSTNYKYAKGWKTVKIENWVSVGFFCAAAQFIQPEKSEHLVPYVLH